MNARLTILDAFIVLLALALGMLAVLASSTMEVVPQPSGGPSPAAKLSGERRAYEAAMKFAAEINPELEKQGLPPWPTPTPLPIGWGDPPFLGACGAGALRPPVDALYRKSLFITGAWLCVAGGILSFIGTVRMSRRDSARAPSNPTSAGTEIRTRSSPKFRLYVTLTVAFTLSAIILF